MLATEKSVNPLPVAESQETTIYHVRSEITFGLTYSVLAELQCLLTKRLVDQVVLYSRLY